MVKNHTLRGEIIEIEKRELPSGRRVVDMILEIQVGYRIKITSSDSIWSKYSGEELDYRKKSMVKARKELTDLAWDIQEGDSVDVNLAEWSVDGIQRFDIIKFNDIYTAV